MKYGTDDKKSKVLVKEFCSKVFYIKSLLYIQENLFEGERTHLLDKTTPSFFTDLNELLINTIFLEMTKITDPAKTYNNENFTVENIIESIEWSNQIIQEITIINDSINGFRKYIKTARNKIIAHNDKKTYLSKKVLGSFPEGEDKKFLNNLELLCNIFHKECFGEIYGEMCMGHSGDVHDFIKVLAKAIAFDIAINEAQGDELFHLDNIFHKVLQNKDK